MATIYKIHPGIGIARLGNSPEDFCISPEKPAALPIDCDAGGNPLLAPDGLSEVTITKFKDAEGRIKRQAARFQIYVYDDESPEGRPLKLGDPVSGGGNQGFLVDVQWRVYLANKKATWYEFAQLDGEHGYAKDHPRRNANITASEARQRLIIDPGPRNRGLHAEAHGPLRPRRWRRLRTDLPARAQAVLDRYPGRAEDGRRGPPAGARRPRGIRARSSTTNSASRGSTPTPTTTAGSTTRRTDR